MLTEVFSGTCNGCGTPYVATSAKATVIDPDEVQKGLEELRKAISAAKTGLSNQIDVGCRDEIIKSMTIRQKNLSGNLDEMMNNINNIYNSLVRTINTKNYYSRAITLHNTKQEEFNDKARGDLAACEASHVEESYYGSSSETSETSE